MQKRIPLLFYAEMIIKNITFVIPHRVEKEFIKIIFDSTDKINQWVDDIKVFKLMEQVDPESFNYAVQLSFKDSKHLNEFNQNYLYELIEEVQSGFTEPMLYFESHLTKVF